MQHEDLSVVEASYACNRPGLCAGVELAFLPPTTDADLLGQAQVENILLK
jgi:hypothetical protein